MRKLFIICALLFCLGTASAQQKFSVASPDGKLKLVLDIAPEKVAYSVKYGKQQLLEDSRLGFEFDSGEFGAGLKAGKVQRRKIDEAYELVVGKVRRARNYCNEMTVPLVERNGKERTVNLVVRAFDDGIAFRYEFPEQKAWDSYVMYDERTQFNLQGNPMALLMYLPGYVNTHEGVYSHVRYDKVARKRLIEMPATFEFDNGVAVAITEAAIRDYAGMYLMKEKGGLVGKLSPKLGQEKIKVETDSFPHRTPWRVISVADRVGGLLETNILTSLNEPCRIEDTSWIKPCRTTFTWWNGNVVPDSTFSPGNNFDTNKYYIDFAARNGLDAHGIYGYAETPWYYDDNFNFGWAGPNADVTKPIPCLNMPRIVEYARSKGVGIHLWVHWRPLYDKLEEAFALYEGWGVKGLMVDFMDRNDQEMIRIQEEILECAARHRLFIQFHGSSKPSGLVRTYPNEFTREGTLNYEVCKWDTLVNADHDIAIPFTRMLAGATDYHLGGFRALPRSEFKIQYVNPHVMSTRCHMLAMYVVLENHLTSLCDTPKAYEGQPGFEVLRTVLLASLLSIWGLTSCENSDTDKVNSYNLEVNLSQNEITAINGIISIKVSIKEFDQLAYLVINKINDTNNISEKYIKSNLSPEYIFEYIIKKDDSSTFYFEFIAVDNNNQSSEISKLIVNKGIVNYSRELKFSNLKCVSRITGAEINGTNGLPIVEFEVNNRTNELYNVGGTDLGIVWELQPGHYGFFFGDTFGSDFYPNFVNPGPNGSNWRSNVLLFSDDQDLSDGLTINGAAMDESGKNAREICYGGKDGSGNGDWTSIPTAAIRANGIDYVHYMNIRNWAGWITNFSSLYKSSDNGITWTRCQNVKFGSTSNFGQVSYFKKDGYIYMVGTITGRDNKPHLARFLEENIENQTEYEFWNGSGWIKGNETAATPLFNDISGELSIAYHPEFKKWILLYFNSTRYDISFRTADHIIGEWSKPQKLVDGWQYSQLYGSYIHPISLKGNILYFIMSMWLPYNTYLMSAELKCNP